MNNARTIALPEKISPSFQKLIDEAHENDKAALRREVCFSVEENNIADFEHEDPLGEKNYRVNDFCVHQYPNRVLLLTTGKCLSYCRYCFRREFTARERGFLSAAELSQTLDYVIAHPHINEILLSGGDPLSASFETLEKTLRAIRQACPDILIRICSRAPIFAPELFNKKLIALFHSCKPLWIIPHINHPAELGAAQRRAITACIDHGISMQSQTVLLCGINDSADILAKLFRNLIVLGVKPGYLFQLDTARGTAHFAVPLKRALEIWSELLEKVSGLSRPEFAVDLENGGGKFSLSALAAKDRIIHVTETGFTVRKKDGSIYRYKDQYLQ